MKAFTKTLIAGSVMAASTVAMAEFSANVAMTTDYIFRGVSQNDNDPAIQGGFDYSHKSGLYAGVWASNVSGYAGSSMEMDLYLGWGGEIAGLSIDVGALRYDYPNTTNKDNVTDEYHFGVSKKFGSVSTGLTFNFSNDFYGAGDATYLDFGAEMPLTKSITAAVHYGITDYDDNTRGTDYDDWSVGLSTERDGFGFDLTYTDTDSGCTGSTCDGQFVFTISKEL